MKGTWILAKNKKKGIFFTIDAILAAGIIFGVILLVSSVYVSEPEKAPVVSLSQDIVRVFTNLKVNDLDNDYVKGLISSGFITKANNTILEQIGEFWAEGELELAKNFVGNISGSLLPSRFGLGVYVDEEEIYLRNKSITRNLVSSRKIISGIEKEKPTEGFASRAILGKIASKKNTELYPFDVIAPCYNSWYDPSNTDKVSIEYSIELPNDANVTNATWFIVPAISGTSVNAYVNDNLVFSGIPSEEGIKNLEGDFTNGTNKVVYEQDVSSYGGCAGDDGTSHVVITYKTQQFNTWDNKTIFPLAVVYADGRISDYEKPVFAPNVDISRMNVSLSVNAAEVYLSFRLEGNEFDIGSKSVVNEMAEWSNDEILNSLNANGICYNDLKDSYFYFIFDFRPISGNVTIFPNSSVIIEGDREDAPFGSIDISQAIDVVSQSNPTGWGWCGNSYRDVGWGFNVPDSATHAYSDFLIGWCMAADADQIAQANGIDLYRHIEGNPGTDPFITAFARFGYTKNSAEGSVTAGQNSFSLHFGSDYAARPVVSYGGNTFFIPNSISYSPVVGKSEGCTWKVETDESGEKTVKVPEDYGGANQCVYNSTVAVYSINDSEQVAAAGIFELLDFDDDGDLDILISEDDMEINTIIISNVPSLWGPAIVEIRVWE
ncbi:hypothetical protein KY347_06710 [Candidatus Woesearchaeota archaeon]|nr:hypothetical protein [Candidatus Woesearchaeota archaeon]